MSKRAKRKSTDLRHDLESLLNRHSRERLSNTPDFILARYLTACLQAFEDGVNRRDRWYFGEHEPFPGDERPVEWHGASLTVEPIMDEAVEPPRSTA